MRFAVECEAVRIRVSTSKYLFMVLYRKTVDYPLRVGSELLPPAGTKEYLRILFMSSGEKSLILTVGLVPDQQ